VGVEIRRFAFGPHGSRSELSQQATTCIAAGAITTGNSESLAILTVTQNEVKPES
jgi:hypothetical protein